MARYISHCSSLSALRHPARRPLFAFLSAVSSRMSLPHTRPWRAWPAVEPARYRRRLRPPCCSASEARPAGVDHAALADRVALLTRLQRSAVAAEDFLRAAELRDQLKRLNESLPLEAQLLQRALQDLRSGDTVARRLAAIDVLSGGGDHR